MNLNEITVGDVLTKMDEDVFATDSFWGKGNFYHPGDKKFCLVGGMAHAIALLLGEPVSFRHILACEPRVWLDTCDFLKRVIMGAQFTQLSYVRKDSVSSMGVITYFNDCPRTTFEEVKTILGKARAELGAFA